MRLRTRAAHGGTAPPVRNVRRAADHDAAAGHASAHAFAGILVNVVGEVEAKTPSASRLDDRPGEGVRRGLIQRCAEAEHLVRADGAVGFDVGDSRSTLGQGARLVEEQDIRASEGFERRAALDDDAPARRSRHAPHQRDRRGQDERAGCGHHQHGDGTHGIAGEDSREYGHRDGQGHEPQGKPVGNAHQRCARFLRLSNQSHDARVRARIGGGGAAETKCATRIDATTPNGIAHHPLHECGFTGERRFIERRRCRVPAGRRPAPPHRERR